MRSATDDSLEKMLGNAGSPIMSSNSSTLSPPDGTKQSSPDTREPVHAIACITCSTRKVCTYFCDCAAYPQSPYAKWIHLAAMSDFVGIPVHNDDVSGHVFRPEVDGFTEKLQKMGCFC